MKDFKIILDAKSFVMGLVACLFIIFFSGFKPVPAEQSGRYQVAVDDQKVIILDTATGDFIKSYGNEWERQKFGEEDVFSEYNPARKFRKSQEIDK